MATPTGPRGPSEARARLIRAASELFYAEGITSVGVDRLIAAAGVTRVTFYRHFPSKEDLVLAYLQGEDEAIQGAFAAAAESGAEPRALVGLVIQALADDIEQQHTRGCPFINAAAEYPDASSPIRVKIADHREWFRSTLEKVITAADLPEPEEKARALVLLRDAAMVGGYLDGAAAIRPTFERTARGVLSL
ncbi:TetR/AcrR family transcriptional regulator [Kribbella antibiotica]|uniref:TetR/AcrR family transcriptional regulator n=1 Tax=Kribbella antibiotica TaxID=190195 RepID=A0A4R5A130_9ACTN|nr:TetR/AcrR family transcriptional regulator [Kribbella antibiotica]TDD63202.1 TetR/AcrR family transcriptional regulator [Kribbella antibiotica]